VAGVYEYWEHGSTGRVWAVKLNRGSVVGVIEIDRRDVNADLLPFLSYHTDEAKVLEDRRHEYKRINGRMVA
jgi:hypothetical protein